MNCHRRGSVDCGLWTIAYGLLTANPKEILQNPFPNLTAFFGMGLHGIEIIPVHERREIMNVMGFGNGKFRQFAEKAVHIVHECRFIQSVQEWMLEVKEIVPSDMRHFEFLMALGNEALHLDRKYTQARRIVFFGIFAKKLLPQANTKKGLSELWNQEVELLFLQVPHGSARLALSRENHPIGLLDGIKVVGQYCLHSQPFQCIKDRLDIACVVFDDCYLHFET